MPRTRPALPRAASLALAGLVVLSQLLLGVASPAGACACGAFIDPVGDRTESSVLQETAVLSLREGTQSIIMGLELDAERTGSTLLMPTPSVPEVSAAQSGTLREMAAATAPREVIEYDIWGDFPFLAGSVEDGASGAGTEESGVTVHEQARIGNYEVAVLGGEAQGVRDWLTENGYDLAGSVSALIDPYAQEDWTFTAVRYAQDAVLSGDVEPLRFDFATEELIYPMRFSQAAQSRQYVQLFVLSDEPVTRSDGSASAQQVDRPWIGDPTSYDWAWSDATLRELVGEDLPMDPDSGRRVEAHSTVTEFQIVGEPESFTTDLTFAADPEAEPEIPTYTTTEIVTVAGIPVGYLLVLAGIVTGAALLAALIAIRAARRSRALLHRERAQQASDR